MKLPADAIIAREKFTHYLLPQSRADESRYLARAGYTLANVDQLIGDLRAPLLSLAAVPSRRTKFGET